jgi:hypothetical protein
MHVRHAIEGGDPLELATDIRGKKHGRREGADRRIQGSWFVVNPALNTAKDIVRFPRTGSITRG